MNLTNTTNYNLPLPTWHFSRLYLPNNEITDSIFNGTRLEFLEFLNNNNRPESTSGKHLWKYWEIII